MDHCLLGDGQRQLDGDATLGQARGSPRKVLPRTAVSNKVFQLRICALCAEALFAWSAHYV